MFYYVGFGLSVFMLMVTLSVGDYWWSLGWLWLMWANAANVADTVQTKEVIARLPESLKVEMYNAVIKARCDNGN
jgi:hypothetical protein